MIYDDAKVKINKFLESKDIPNILFIGDPCSGKKRLCHHMLTNIYKTKEVYDDCVLKINCALFKGINYIREELKFFAKKNVTKNFKSVVFFNSEHLTVDAQSSLRRCIELYNHSTRFFIIIQDENQLLKPIISRFSIIRLTNINEDVSEYYLNGLKYMKSGDYDIKKYKKIDVGSMNQSSVCTKFKTIISLHENNKLTSKKLRQINDTLIKNGVTGEYLLYCLMSDDTIFNKHKFTLLDLLNKGCEIENESMYIYFILTRFIK